MSALFGGEGRAPVRGMRKTIIGVPREIKAQESRVALTPSAAWQLIRNGHTVLVENDAGSGSGFLTEEYRTAGCVAVEVNRRLPLLEPMSEIAGSMSALVGSYHLQRHTGGRGVLMSGVPGVLPGKVVVIGGGTAGVN